MATELYLFGRFHVKAGHEADVEKALCEVVARTQRERGCKEIQGYRSSRDPQLYYIHSRWTDETAFELHAAMPHTTRFLDLVQKLVDQPIEVSRTEQIT
jgi:quinol monooxygenase YgiN